jgi:hypothetical protein
MLALVDWGSLGAVNWDHDGLLVVRGELCDRLDRLQRAAERLTVRDLLSGIDHIRTVAGAYGLTPVVLLAEAFERAVRTQPRGCPAGIYFDRLRDAIGCDPLDARAGEAMLASVSIRFEA